MRTARLALGVLLCAATAHAAAIGPVTTGTWIQAPAPCECGDTPVSNRSLDGRKLNATFIIAALTGLSTLDGFEYLLAGDGFTFPGWSGEELYSNTAYTAGRMEAMADGHIRLDNGEGIIFYSATFGADHFLLWRRQLPSTPTQTATEYWLCGEDLPAGDVLDLENAGAATQRLGDCNDRIARMTVLAPIFVIPEPPVDPPVCVEDCGQPDQPSVPEPASAILIAVGAAVRRWRRAA